MCVLCSGDDGCDFCAPAIPDDYVKKYPKRLIENSQLKSVVAGLHPNGRKFYALVSGDAKCGKCRFAAFTYGIGSRHSVCSKAIDDEHRIVANSYKGCEMYSRGDAR